MGPKKKNNVPMVTAVLVDDDKSLISGGNDNSFAGSSRSGASHVLNQSQSLSRSHEGSNLAGTKANFPFREPNVAGARDFLGRHGWPEGMQNALIKSLNKLPLRFFICDDSGSMLTNDGHRIMGSGANTKIIGCTRWSELVESLRFHAELAEASMAPSEFRLINVQKPILVGKGDGDTRALDDLYELFDNGPAGQTPICDHIRAVIADIRSMEKKLRENKQRVAVIISTDGEATDGDIAETMKPLQDLPVWVVIKLCTDDDKIVSYWNDIDEELELEIDVLDDFVAEGEEVFAVNSWLTYTEPIHKLREFGAIIKEFDLLDEGTLSTEQMRVVVSIMLENGDHRRVPHPELDWGAFLKYVDRRNKEIPTVFDAHTKTMLPWINIDYLCKVYKKPNVIKSAACVIS